MAKYTFGEMFDHSSSSLMTMMDDDGYIKYAPHNIFPGSVDLSDNTYWLTNFSSVQEDINTNAPDGSSSAFKMTSTSTNSYIYQNYNSGGTPHTISVFAKADDANWLRMNHNNALTYGAWFDLSTGTIGTVKSPVSEAVMFDVGNGWYYCAVRWDSPLSSSERWVIGVTATDNTTVAPTNGTGIFLWGAMVTKNEFKIANNPDMDFNVANTSITFSPHPNAYSPSYSTASYLPRRKSYRYNSNTTSYEVDGLIIETESRTNYFSTSDDPSSAFGVSDLVSTSSNTSLGPLFDDAYLIRSTSTGRSRFFTSGGITTGQEDDFKTFSFFYHPLESSPNPFIHVRINPPGSTPRKGICLNTSTDVITTGYYDGANQLDPVEHSEVQDYGNGWKRCIVTANNVGDSGFDTAVLLYFSNTATNSTTSTIDDCFFMYGLQLEDGFGASSYIPTFGSTETRGAETLSFSQLISNTVNFGSTTSIGLSGELRYVEEANSAATVGLYEWYSDSNNYIAAVLNTVDGTGGYDFHVKYQGTEHVLESTNRNVDTEGNRVEFNVIQSIDGLQNQLDAAVEGSNEANVSISGIFNLDPIDFYIGAENSLNAAFNGSMNELRIWEYALNNDEMANETDNEN